MNRIVFDEQKQKQQGQRCQQCNPLPSQPKCHAIPTLEQNPNTPFGYTEMRGSWCGEKWLEKKEEEK